MGAARGSLRPRVAMRFLCMGSLGAWSRQAEGAAPGTLRLELLLAQDEFLGSFNNGLQPPAVPSGETSAAAR